MERDGLINRYIYAEVPPRVEYDLTDLGESLLHAVSSIASWSEAHVAKIMDARLAYDNKQYDKNNNINNIEIQRRTTHSRKQ